MTRKVLHAYHPAHPVRTPCLPLRPRSPGPPAERERISATNVASTMVSMLVNNPLVEQLDLTSLRVLSCGGSPQSPAGETHSSGGGNTEGLRKDVWHRSTTCSAPSAVLACWVLELVCMAA